MKVFARLDALLDRLNPAGRDERTLWLLLLVIAFDYADRTLIGAMGPSLKHVFHASNMGLGALVTAVNFTAAITTIPMGILTDRGRRIRLLALALFVWTVAMGVVGASVSFLMLLISRLFLGVVSSASGPVMPSLVGDLVPVSRRSRAMGVVDSGQLFGTGAAYLLAAVVTGFLSFRFGFWILGVGGALLGFLLLKRPEPGRTTGAGRLETGDPQRKIRESRIETIIHAQEIPPSQSSLLCENPEGLTLWEAARYVFRVKTNVVVIVSRSVADYFFAGLGTFAIIFATRQYHVSEQDADIAALSLGVGALAGIFVMGRAADRFLRRGKLNARLWVSATGYLLAPFMLLPALFADRLYLALPAIIASAFLLVGAGPPLDAVRVDVQVPRLRGRSEGIRQVVRTLAEGASPLIFGSLAALLLGGGQAGLQAAFLVSLPLVFVAGLLLLFGLRTYGPDVAAVLESSPARDPNVRSELKSAQS